MTERTPSQTIGPFFHGSLAPTAASVAAAVPGTRIHVHGQVVDGAGAPVTDALLELRQADASGRYAEADGDTGAEPEFAGFARLHTDAQGAFALDTILPGSVPGPDDAPQAPHLLVQIFARGLLTPLLTRIYLADQPLNARDPILARVPEPRRPSLIARRTGEQRYRFDIALQGPDETVFFDV